MQQYQAKRKKKEVDPNAPPRPTLLGHEKELKGYRNQIGYQSELLKSQSIAIKTLERQVNTLQSRLDAIQSLLNRNIINKK